MIVFPKLFRYFLRHLVYFEIRSVTMVVPFCTFIHSLNHFTAKLCKFKYFASLLYSFEYFVKCGSSTDKIKDISHDKQLILKKAANISAAKTIKLAIPSTTLNIKGIIQNCNKKKEMNYVNTPNKEMTQYIR